MNMWEFLHTMTNSCCQDGEQILFDGEDAESADTLASVFDHFAR
jgi:hypothetical protein